jgi:hypothetical protein
MYNFLFECKVKFDKLDENGINKSVTETSLVDALSHAEAENRIIKEMQPYVSGELLVVGVKRVKIAEMFGVDDNGDKNIWYKSKVNFISLDEEKGVEKRTPSTMYAKADDIESALQKVKEGMKNTLSDYEIAAIIETQIMDYYPYSAPENGTAFYDEESEANN